MVGTAHLGVRVNTKLKADPPHVLVDRVQIQQVLINLMRNAVEAMQDSATRRLDIGTAASEDGDVVISVIDSGAGIPPEIADAAVSAVRHQQDKRHGRRPHHFPVDRRSPWRPVVDVAERGRGNRFPLHASGPGREGRADMTNEPTVYVVDDDPAILDSIKVLVESEGFHVVTYRFGESTSWPAGRAPARRACLVADIRMPEMSGLELQQELNTRGTKLPVIIMTGHGDVPLAVAR